MIEESGVISLRLGCGRRSSKETTFSKFLVKNVERYFFISWENFNCLSSAAEMKVHENFREFKDLKILLPEIAG